MWQKAEVRLDDEQGMSSRSTSLSRPLWTISTPAPTRTTAEESSRPQLVSSAAQGPGDVSFRPAVHLRLAGGTFTERTGKPGAARGGASREGSPLTTALARPRRARKSSTGRRRAHREGRAGVAWAEGRWRARKRVAASTSAVNRAWNFHQGMRCESASRDERARNSIAGKGWKR